MDLILSNESRFTLDLTGRWETEDVLAEITLEDGRYLQLEKEGKWLAPDDADLYRLHRWHLRNENKL